jgi:large-conductance mechanosensitive channel
MLSFMLQEGVITIGTISGIFTALLLNSVKNNIIDPCVEKVAPINKLINRPISEIIEDIKDDSKLNNSNDKNNKNFSPQVSKEQPQLPQGGNQGGGLFNQFGTNNHGNQFGGPGKTEIKWKIFLRDLITWLIIMLILYLAWKHILHPIKMKGNINVPSHNTQYFPMGIGKLKK